MLALVFAGVSFSREQQASGHRAAGGDFVTSDPLSVVCFAVRC